MQYHQFADDTQIYIAGKSSELSNDIAIIASHCTTAVQAWFLSNDLLLNADKSEVMLIGTRSQLRNHKTIGTYDIASCSLPIKDNIKILGVTIDQELNLSNHVNLVFKACNYHMYALRQIRRFLTPEVAKTVACSIVGSRLDYCNALLSGLSKANLGKLQRVQDNLARIVENLPRRSHVRDALIKLMLSSSSYLLNTECITKQP